MANQDKIRFNALTEHGGTKCGFKKQYESRHKAKIAAEKASAKIGLNFRPYKCKRCKFYHLTTQEKK